MLYDTVKFFLKDVICLFDFRKSECMDNQWSCVNYLRNRLALFSMLSM